MSEWCQLKQKQRRARQSVPMVPKKGYNCSVTFLRSVFNETKLLTTLDRERSSFFPQSQARRAGKTMSTRSSRVLSIYCDSLQEKNKRLLAVYNRVKNTGHNIKGNHFETLASGNSVYLWECRPLSPVAKLYSITSYFGIQLQTSSGFFVHFFAVTARLPRGGA